MGLSLGSDDLAAKEDPPTLNDPIRKICRNFDSLWLPKLLNKI